MDVLSIFIDAGVYLHSQVLKLKAAKCFFLQGGKIMEESDLEAIGITSAEHRKKILDSAKALPQLTPIGNQSTEATCNYCSCFLRSR